MGKPAARKTDNHSCPLYDDEDPHVGGPVVSGCANVNINGLQAARIGDPTLCQGVGAIDPIAEGAPSVCIGGSPAARLGDATSHGGKLVQGSPNVFIGDADGCADGRCKGEPASGSPVNPLLGIKVLPPETDIDLPSPLGWRWFRFYSSDEARIGLFGQGWNHPAALALSLDTDTVLTDTQGRNIRFFGRLAPGEERYSASEGLWLVRGGSTESPKGRWRGLTQAILHDPAHYVATDGAGHFFVFGPTVVEAPPRTVASHAPAATPPAASSRPDRASAGNDTPPEPTEPCARLPLLAQHTRLGPVVQFTWRGARLEAVTDSAGRRYRLRYEAICTPTDTDSGERLVRIELITDPTRCFIPTTTTALVHYRYNPAGDLIEVLDRYKRWQRRFSWRNHIMIGHEAPGARAVRYEYDRYAPEGRVLRQTQTHGLVYRYAYHPDHTEVTDSLGRVERYWREGEAGLMRVARHDRADGSVLINRHDPHGRLLATHLGRAPLAHMPAVTLAEPDAHPRWFRTTRFQRNAAGRPTVVDAAGLITRYDWGPDGALCAITDADGATTRFEHDPLGRLVAQTGPDGARTAFLYDDADGAPAVQPTRIRDARGGIKMLVFDELGQLTAYTDCSGHTTRHRFDIWGRLLETVDASGACTTYVLDAFGRVAEVVDAAGRTTRYQFDSADRVVAIEDAAGRLHRQRYDDAGRLVAQQPEGGHEIVLGFDAADRLTELVTPNGAVHRLAFDAADRLVSETTPDGRTLRYTYDALGQLVEREDMGLVTVHSHDPAGRLVARELPATAHAPAEVQRFAWRGTRLVEAATAAHTLAFEHDAAGRVIRETHTQHLPGTEPEVRTTTHAYAILGTRATTRLPNGLELGQLTYGSGHVHQLRIADRILADIEHDALYRPTTLRLGGYDGLVQSLAFDALGALGALTASRLATPGGAPLAEARYAYDALGRLLAREGTAPRRYTYDALDRLAGEEGMLSGAHATQTPAHRAEYRFDPAGNRLSVAAALTGVEADDWAATVRANLHNPAFNLLGPRPGPAQRAEATRCPDNRLHTLEGTHYRYDEWGNLIERTDPDGARTRFGYDAEHRLVSLARYHGDTLAHQASYSYDAFGRRRSKVLWLPTAEGALGARQLTRYDWDDDRLTGEHLATLAPEADQWHSTEKVFAYHPNTFTPLAQITCQPHANGKASIKHIEWYHTDQIGTPLALLDAEGKETWRIELDAWGRRLDAPVPAEGVWRFSGATDPNEQPIRLPGQYFDAESGMHYNRYRYYDPKAGRYVTQDPIGLAGGSNIYTYPLEATRVIDPLGLTGYGDLNSRPGPVDQSGRSPRTGGTITGPYNAPPRAIDRIADRIVDRLVKDLTGIGGLVTKSPLTVGGTGAMYAKEVGACSTVTCQQDQQLYCGPHHESSWRFPNVDTNE